MINRKLAHSVFTGPTGSGKSSLIQRLLGRLNRLKKSFSKSTGVSESIIIVDINEINPATIHPVAMVGSDTWREVDYEVSLIKQMGEKSIVIPAAAQHSPFLPSQSFPSQSMSSQPSAVGKQDIKFKDTENSKRLEKKVIKLETSTSDRKDNSKGKVPLQSIQSSARVNALVVSSATAESIISAIKKYGFQAFKNYLEKTSSLLPQGYWGSSRVSGNATTSDFWPIHILLCLQSRS